eukprot:scaffold175_cov414-Prasinococcus_capsulatus_cf.AAC.26
MEEYQAKMKDVVDKKAGRLEEQGWKEYKVASADTEDKKRRGPRSAPQMQKRARLRVVSA